MFFNGTTVDFSRIRAKHNTENRNSVFEIKLFMQFVQLKKTKIQIWEKMFPALDFSPTSLSGIRGVVRISQGGRGWGFAPCQSEGTHHQL